MGMAYGDALGAAYEFLPAGLIGEPRFLAYGGEDAGTWTDDTAMAIGLAHALQAGQWRPHVAVEEWVRWMDEDGNGIGIWTARVLSVRPIAQIPKKALAWWLAGAPAGGNGALMRVAPVAIAYEPEEAARIGAAQARLTHPDPVGVRPAAVWAAALSAVVRGEHVSGALVQALELAGRSEEEALREVENARRGIGLVPNGDGEGCLRAAMHAVLNAGESFAGGVRAAVKVGDDTDTVGAVAGAMLGAMHGREAIEGAEILHGWPWIARPGVPELEAVADSLLC